MEKILQSVSSEQRFQSLVREAPFSTALLTGEDLVVELANEISLKLWGKDKSIIGKPLLEGIPEMQGQPVYEKLVEVYRTGKTYEGKESVAYLEINGLLQKLYVSFVYKPIHSEDGTITSVLAIGYDVTEHVESRKKLIESEERARLAVEAADLGTFDISYLTGNIITSARFDAIFGYSEPHVYKDYINRVHPLDRGVRDLAHKKAIKTGVLEYQARLVWEDGTIRWVRFKGKVLYDSGVPVRLLGTILDVTDQVLSIKRLEESEERFRMLITETPEVGTGLYMGKDLTIQYVNGVMLKFWEKNESVIGKTFCDALPELEGQPFPEQLKTVFNTGITISAKEAEAILLRNGKPQKCYYNYTYKALRNSEGEIYGIHHMAIDVTEQVLNKQKLIESEKRFRNLLMQAPFGICILKGNNFYVDFANDTFLQMLGRKREMYVGKPLWEGLPEVESQIYNKLLHEVLRTGTTFHGKEYEMKIIRNGQNETIYVDFTYDAIKDESGTVDGILVLAIEVTDKVAGRKEVEKARDKFNSILESLPQISWTTNPNGQINFVSQQWYDYTGQIERTELGDNGSVAFDPLAASEIAEQWKKSIAEKSVFEYEGKIRRYDGAYRWHLMRAIPIFDDDGKISLWVGTSTDIHDQKLFSEELERKIKERTRELERSNSELEQFAYVSSHDLQEPLRKISVFTNMLTNSLGEIPEKSKGYLDRITSSTTRMLTLIKDILEFSRLAKSERIFGPVDLDKTLKNVIEDFDLLIEQKAAVISADKLGTIEALPLQMHQLFHNLLSNSLKFADENRNPHIQVRIKNLRSDEIKRHSDLNAALKFIEIQWEDNGIGFSEEYAEQIFIIFQRLNDRQTYSGTGIGLAMCKKIAANHHGDIYVKSEVGKGTIFHIILPLKQST